MKKEEFYETPVVSEFELTLTTSLLAGSKFDGQQNQDYTVGDEVEDDNF